MRIRLLRPPVLIARPHRAQVRVDLFSGVIGAPAQCFPAAASGGGPYTTLPGSPPTHADPDVPVTVVSYP